MTFFLSDVCHVHECQCETIKIRKKRPKSVLLLYEGWWNSVFVVFEELGHNYFKMPVNNLCVCCMTEFYFACISHVCLKVLKKQQSNVTGGDRVWSTVRQRFREKQPACVQPQHLQCVESVNIQPHTVLARMQSVSAFHFAPSHSPRWHTVHLKHQTESCGAIGDQRWWGPEIQCRIEVRYEDGEDLIVLLTPKQSLHSVFVGSRTLYPK